MHQYQRLFRRMGFRLRKPSPQVAQADPLKIAAVKNTPPLSAKGRR
ncbi:MAG: winged helix-turn-helix domain-containing protein [Gammaproteobacteria bacterium]